MKLGWVNLEIGYLASSSETFQTFDVNLRQIEIFNAVYLQGSASAAARSLGVSQPTVSKVIKRFEDRLGFKLFERVSGRLYPTSRARTLFESVAPMFEQFSNLETLARRLASEGEGHLRFAMTPAFSLEVGPKAISQFVTVHQNATLEAETLHGGEISKRLIQGDIDLGLVFDAPRYAGLQAQRIGSTEFVCISRAADNLIPEGNVQISDLANLKVIQLNSKSVLGQRLQDKLHQRSQNSNAPQLIVETYYLAKHLVRQGAGVAIVDAITAFSGDRSGLRFHSIPELETVGVDLVSSLANPETDLVQTLKHALTDELSQFINLNLH